MKKLGLYIHIPFCVKKCNYCDFYSLGCLDKMSEYIKALEKQIILESPLYKDYEIDTVFIGGGTPSLIEPNDFISLASTLKKHLNLTQGLEFTIEANPGTITKEKLLAYKQAGVNRLSIGLQSTNDRELKELGRIHTLSEFKDGYKLARDCGFDNISIDIMYSLPSQTIDIFEKTLSEVIGFLPEHISSYSLKIEKGTPFGKIKDSLNIPSEDDEYDMYMAMCQTLEKHGYNQYEISNFSKAGYESRHNLKYWLSEEYIGFGPSAHSYFNGKRYYYEKCLDSYIKKINSGSLPEKIEEEKDKNASAQISNIDEYLMLRLRLSRGVDENDVKEKFGIDLLTKYPRILDFLKSGYMKKEGSAYSFTAKGFFVSNFILTEILSFE